MNLLVLGGTVFLSRAVAVEALKRGHDVTCALPRRLRRRARGATQVTWDRADPTRRPSWRGVGDARRRRLPPSLTTYDARSLPSRTRTGCSCRRVNVYADESVPGWTRDQLPLHEPITEDVDLAFTTWRRTGR